MSLFLLRLCCLGEEGKDRKKGSGASVGRRGPDEQVGEGWSVGRAGSKNEDVKGKITIEHCVS